jgi:RNA polymerase sigma factor (sigma-70 family)
MLPITRPMPADRGRHRFATTQWSQVIAACGVSPAADTALAELCEAYWYPVYAFVRRSGHSVDDAKDLTQAFFTRVLEKHYLKDARPERGRFRSFLLASVRHFLSNERDWRQTLKRGGRQTHVPLDFGAGEHRYQLEPADELTPERVYEHRWTLAVLDKAMARLSSKYEQTGRQDLFGRLKPHLTGDEPESYRELADALGVSDGSLRVAVHRLRKEFKATLRGAIAETVERDEDVDDELRYLLTVVGRQN